MKVFLDDERPTPKGWVGVRWPDEAIRLLESGDVEELSLDHDLGDDDRGTGYDVVLWIEEAVVVAGFRPPRIQVHSANSSARQKMLAGIAAIERMAAASSRVSPPARIVERSDASCGNAGSVSSPNRDHESPTKTSRVEE